MTRRIGGISAAAGVTLGAGVLVAAVLWCIGQAGLWISPDTDSYLAAASPVSLGAMRLPLYGWLIAPMLADPTLSVWLPMGQGVLFLAASAWLVGALGQLSVSRAAGMAVGVSLVSSNVALLWGRAALPELPGHAALLVALAVTVEMAAGRARIWRMAVAAVATTLAWVLRPSLLPFVVLLPMLVLMLPHRGRVRGTAIMLLLACMAPMLGLVALRSARLGDANVVSFGGFQMSGMAALMLTPEIAERLPETDRAMAQAILGRREALVSQGRALDIPLNSTGQRSFVSTAVLYFDILARTHDVVLYEAVGGLRETDESWVAFNARLQRLAFHTIKAAPGDYVAWVIGATSRLLGHALVLNPLLVVATALLGLMLLRSHPLATPAMADMPVLLALSLIWLVGTGSLIVLTTFPAQRYIDSFGMFLPVWPLYALFRLRRA